MNEISEDNRQIAEEVADKGLTESNLRSEMATIFDKQGKDGYEAKLGEVYDKIEARQEREDSDAMPTREGESITQTMERAGKGAELQQ
jgi:hypothetical protein